MANRKGSDFRLKLFELGNTRCPICLTDFTRNAVERGVDVTLEHVPPKTLGGSVRCLTCADCNSSASRHLDQAAAMLNRAKENRKAGRGRQVELDVFGTKHSTYFSPEGITTSELSRRIADNPNAASMVDQLPGRKFLLLTEIKRGPDWDVSRGITIRTKRPSMNHLELSWLRSAYLLVFSLLGPAGLWIHRKQVT